MSREITFQKSLYLLKIGIITFLIFKKFILVYSKNEV